MDPLLVIIVDLFHLMDLIVALDSQCHKFSYLIVFDLLPYKRSIYDYLLIHYVPH